MPIFLHDEYRADAYGIRFGTPAVLALGIEIAQEFGDEVGDERLKERAQAVVALVEHAVALDHPAHVAGAMGAQGDGAFGRTLENRVRRLERLHHALAMRTWQRGEHLLGRSARRVIQCCEGLATLGRERQPHLARVVLRALAGNQLEALQSLEQAAEVAEVEVEVRAELARRARAALTELVEDPRLRQRKRAAEVVRL